MLSYRHGFHAGNFADVLKHLVLQRILAHLSKKDTPFCCIDTHAGAGGYTLDHPFALKNREFDNGIAKLWGRSDIPEIMQAYLQHIKDFNLDSEIPIPNLKAQKQAQIIYPKLKRYPGSPWLIQKSLRQKDRLICFELHSQDVTLLTSALANDQRIKIKHLDGLQHSIALLPPIERRGLVFIDPSYEIKSDYLAVVETLKKMHQRFAGGIYALWYPVVDRKKNQVLEQSLINSGIKNILLIELGILQENGQNGMTANGLIVINPPWTLKTEMASVLPWLQSTLQQSEQAYCRLEQLVNE